MTIQQDIQKPALPALIKLFEIDATAITGSVYRFTPMTNGGAAVNWGGFDWSPFPIELTGISHTSTGAPARPRLSVSNIDGFFRFLVGAYEDMTGAKFIYRETFATYLGTSISMPPLYYTLAKKLDDNKTGIVFELKSAGDVESKWLPARQMLRDGALPFPGLGVNKSTR
jgi:lambda family phage minor tail protein L